MSNRIVVPGGSRVDFQQMLKKAVQLKPTSRGRAVLQITQSPTEIVVESHSLRKADWENRELTVVKFRGHCSVSSTTTGTIAIEVTEALCQWIEEMTSNHVDNLVIEQVGNSLCFPNEPERDPIPAISAQSQPVSQTPVSEATILKRELMRALERVLVSESSYVTENRDMVLRLHENILEVIVGNRDRQGIGYVNVTGSGTNSAVIHLPFETVALLLEALYANPTGKLGLNASKDGCHLTVIDKSWSLALTNYTGMTLAISEPERREITTVTLQSKECTALSNLCSILKSALNQNSIVLKGNSKGVIQVSAGNPDPAGQFQWQERLGHQVMPVPFEVRVDPVVLARALDYFAKNGGPKMRVTPNRELEFVAGDGSNRIHSLECHRMTGNRNTKIFASAGCHHAKRSIHKHFLMAFSELPKRVQSNPEQFEKYLEVAGLLDGEKKIFMDSGAYSVWQSGETVDLDQYIRFLKYNKRFLHLYVALDVIRGSLHENFANYRKMVDAGLNPIYVWHLYENEAYLERLWREFPKLNLLGAGGAPHTSDPIREPYVQSLFAGIPGDKDVNVHLFGMTTTFMLRKYRGTYSADSTSWNITARNREIDTPFGQFSVQPGREHIYTRSIYREEIEKFVLSLSYGNFEFDLKKLIPKIDEGLDWVYQYNLAFLNWYEKFRYHADWMKLEGRFLTNDELLQRGEKSLDNLDFTIPSGIAYPLLHVA